MMYYVLSIILTLHWKVPDAQNEGNKRQVKPFVMNVGLFTTCPFGHLMPWCPKGDRMCWHMLWDICQQPLWLTVSLLCSVTWYGTQCVSQWHGWKRCWWLVSGVANKLFSLASGDLDSNSHSAWQMALPFDPSQFLANKIGLTVDT